MAHKDKIIFRLTVLLSIGLSIFSGCQLSSPSIVTQEGFRVYIPGVISENVLPIVCDSGPDNNDCYMDTLNELRIIIHYRKIENEKFWEQFFTLDSQLQFKQELICNYPDRVTNYEHRITPQEYEVWGYQVELDIDRLYEPQKQFFYYEYICPTYRFRCEIGTSYKDQRKYSLTDWVDQFKDIRHEIVR